MTAEAGGTAADLEMRATASGGRRKQLAEGIITDQCHLIPLSFPPRVSARGYTHYYTVTQARHPACQSDTGFVL